MEYGCTQQMGSPLRGRALEELQGFLAGAGLRYAPGIEYTALVRDQEERIIAAASLEGNVIKCVAVDPAHQGEDLTATVLTALRRQAMELGRRRLFLYTKPENCPQFTGLGFQEVARAEQAVLMEDRRGGFAAWAESIRSPAATGAAGAAVMNCNPMTLGHLYLVEQAAARCDFLYLLIVSEDRSAHLPNVAVAGTGDYLISQATFPDYFLKDVRRSGEVWTGLDIAVFCRLARQLGITRRFVGSEPFCPVTSAYNRAMAAALPAQGIELVELPRLARDGTPISATAVRKLLCAGRGLVPEATFAYFADAENRSRFLRRAEGGSQKRE